MPPDDWALEAARSHLQKYDMGFDDCLQLNPAMQAEVDDLADLITRHATEAVAAAAPGIVREARIRALEWAHGVIGTDLFWASRNVTDEITRLTAEGGSDAES